MLHYESLTNEVRAAMLTEIAGAAADGSIYASPRLSPRGLLDYPNLLLEAAEFHTDTWLANELKRNGRLNTVELRQGKPIKVASNAAVMLAEGEFNRYYVRAVCQIALQTDPEAMVEIYRAKSVTTPRSESERKIGTRISAAALLRDLRATSNADMNTVLGVPAGPNSGLSVRFVAIAA